MCGLNLYVLKFVSFLRRAFLYLMLLSVAGSCVNTRKATYFNDVKDASVNGATIIPESLIQKNDILSITVGSLNPEATEIFNMPKSSAAGTMSGYLVNEDGNIQFPMLGLVKAAGLTKSQLKTSITRQLEEKKLLTDPVVSIRWENSK